MIPVPSGVRVWLAVGRTDMRKGMNGLALQVQQVLGRDPHAGDLYVFRGVRGDLIKIVWHDGIGMSLYAKRLERGRFIWPSPADGVIAITASQLGYMLEGIDWRNPESDYHLALHVSYPSDEDNTRAAARGVNAGFDIMIHGIRNGGGWIGAFHRMQDWTAGCIALTNRDVDEVWRAVPAGTPIEIRP